MPLFRSMLPPRRLLQLLRLNSASRVISITASHRGEVLLRDLDWSDLITLDLTVRDTEGGCAIKAARRLKEPRPSILSKVVEQEGGARELAAATRGGGGCTRTGLTVN
jgi:hypothetical protein